MTPQKLDKAALEAELLPCPFCGDVLEIRQGRNPYGRHSKDSDCILAGLAVNIPFDRFAWNRRASLPPDPARAARPIPETAALVERVKAMRELQRGPYSQATCDMVIAALNTPVAEAEGKPDPARALVKKAVFADWWSDEGQYLDPDTDDVPWFDKRRGLAEMAFHAGALSDAATWPDFAAPAKYDNPAKGWTDPKLPDFRLIWNVARECGYSVGLHGSMKRDVDLIAAPWVEGARPPEQLIAALCSALKAREVGPREDKPFGRLAVSLQIDGWFRVIDLSIVHRATLQSIKDADHERD